MLLHGKNTIQVDYPVVNIFGCSTPDWLQKSVVGSDIDGGFINRFMPFLYERMPYVRNQTIKSEFYDVFVSMLRGFLTKPEGAKHYSFSDDAAESYHEWAERRYETALNDPVGAAITTRITDHARRIALAFALSTNADCDTKIALETWQTAQTVAEYLSDVAVYIFSEVGRDSDKMRMHNHKMGLFQKEIPQRNPTSDAPVSTVRQDRTEPYATA